MIKRCVTFVAAVAVLLLALPATTAMAQSGGGWTVTRSTTQGGGASSAGADPLRGSVGSAAGTVSGGGYTVRGGFWQPGLQAPLAVTLAGFTARQDGASILVEWQTVSEIDCTGFNLYRGTNDDWAGASLLAFVPSQAPGSAEGFEYNYRDAGGGAGSDLLLLAGGCRPWRSGNGARPGHGCAGRSDRSYHGCTDGQRR